jgi:hypothetical protein
MKKKKHPTSKMATLQKDKNVDIKHLRPNVMFLGLLQIMAVKVERPWD